MSRRLKLHDLLVGILGSRYVYFQPPESIKMTYPCIVYKYSKDTTSHANNLPYNSNKRYSIQVIDKNPDTEIPDKLGKLPLCSSERFYTADNLNHYVYNLYF